MIDWLIDWLIDGWMDRLIDWLSVLFSSVRAVPAMPEDTSESPKSSARDFRRLSKSRRRKRAWRRKRRRRRRCKISVRTKSPRKKKQRKSRNRPCFLPNSAGIKFACLHCCTDPFLRLFQVLSSSFIIFSQFEVCSFSSTTVYISFIHAAYYVHPPVPTYPLDLQADMVMNENRNRPGSWYSWRQNTWRLQAAPPVRD